MMQLSVAIRAQRNRVLDRILPAISQLSFVMDFQGRLVVGSSQKGGFRSARLANPPSLDQRLGDNVGISPEYGGPDPHAHRNSFERCEALLPSLWGEL